MNQGTKKIVHLVPGSGGTFYCQNCVRDGVLIRALRSLGHDVVLVPLYLPLFDNAPADADREAPVFYGAVNIYLSQKLPLARRLPKAIRRWLDSPPLLRAAAAMAGSTRSEGLADLTVSMLEGTAGRQARELDQLTTWLSREGVPDIIHFSNALLLGMAPRIRERLGTRLVCSLQDEDVWLDPMPPEPRERALELLRDRVRTVDAFVAPSQYYADVASDLLGLPPERVHSITPGIDQDGYESGPEPQPPVLGFLSRLSEASGLHLLIEAFLSLRSDPALRGLRLHLSGGSTADDRAFLKAQFRRLRTAKAESSVQVFDKLDQAARVSFLRGLTVLSTPCPAGEAFGLQIAEAMACGVPCVQPAVGAYPELIDTGRTGIVCASASARELAAALRRVLTDADLRQSLRANASAEARLRFSPARYAEAVDQLYSDVIAQDP